MLIRTIVSPLLGARCSVVVDDQGRCVVVDPGAGVVAEVRALVAHNGWTPLGVLATHGHLDHTWSAGELCDGWDVALHVHEGDAYRIDEPVSTLGPLGPQLAAMVDLEAPRRPARVEIFTAGDDASLVLHLGSGPDEDRFVVRAIHVPGHTEGSTVYLVDAPGPTALTGDVLFAGTIGRTDLPGGDHAAMTASLRLLAALDPSTVVLPGHGPGTTIGAELAANPYLRPVR